MIKKVYVRAERFHPFSNFKVSFKKLENFIRMKRACKNIHTQKHDYLQRVPCVAKNKQL